MPIDISHTTQMHRALYITEIVESILQEIAAQVTSADPGERHRHTGLTRDAYKTIRSLGSMARVFYEPCLDAMWHTQTSLVPLLRSIDIIKTHLEPDIGWWTYVRESIDDSTLTLTRFDIDILASGMRQTS